MSAPRQPKPSLFAWVASPATGRHFVANDFDRLADGRNVPRLLVYRDLMGAQAARPRAVALAARLGMPMRLVEFHEAKTYEVITP